MDNLLNEVITNISQCFPQRYIPILSTICKKWQSILTQPLFLNTLDIYSIQQLKNYIEMRKEKSINNNLPLDHSVKHLYFHIYNHVYTSELVAMIDTFPNLHSIQRPFTFSGDPRHYINRFHQLEHIPYWYQSGNNHWMDLISNYPHQIKSLAFTFINKLLPSYINEQEQQPSSSSSSSPLPSSSSPSSPHPPIIYLTSIIPYKTRHSYFNLSDIIRYKIYTITLPTLPSVTYLTINCERYDDNEYMFEFIHHSCPQLISLTLAYLNMHISDDYANNRLLLQPNLQLKGLSTGHQIY